VVCGRGTPSILRARGRLLAWSSGPSTSPLGVESMPLRVVGALLIAVAALLVAIALNNERFALEIAALPPPWSARVSRDVFLARGRFLEMYMLACAAITATAGAGMLFRKWWPVPLYGAALAALLLLGFNSLTQLLALSDFRFNNPPGVTEVLFSSTVGLLAAFGFLFRPRESTPNNRWRGP